MINIPRSHFEKIIVHTVLKKRRDQEHSNCLFEVEELTLEARIIELLKERINNAIGIESKSFKLKIVESGDESFFKFARDIMSNDGDFVAISQRIAQKLAVSQTNSNISGGYIFIVKGVSVENENFVIALKAEVHNALSLRHVNGRADIQFIEDIFLSPSTKFYKLGIIYEEANDQETFPNNEYSSLLFDNQFNPTLNPAEFFTKNFLGLDLNSSDKIQTRKFFDQVNSFIYDEISDPVNRMELTSLVRNIMKYDMSNIIDPESFRDRFFGGNDDIKQRFSTQVLINYPRQIIKNTSLLDFSLKTKKVFFPNKIKIEGPEDTFDRNVQVFPHITEDVIRGIFNGGGNRHSMILVKGEPYERES